MNREFSFTVRRLAGLMPPAAGRVYYRDESTPGLQLCVTAAGAKTYYFVRRIDGKPTRVRLGQLDQMGLQDARNAAMRRAAEVADGKNPQAERRARRDIPTLQQLFDHWLEHAKAHKRTWRDDERQFKKYLAAWQKRRINAISQSDVAAWHAKLGDSSGPIQANRTLALLSTMFGRAGRLGYNGPNPCVDVDRFPERVRERYLSADEMEPFFEALAAEEPLWRDFFLLAILTGVRRGNIATMRWAALDLVNGVWHIPASESKNGKPVAIALSPPAIAILQARRKITGGEYVFPASGRNGRPAGHVADPRKAWSRIIKASGIDNLRMHDLRRTLGSWLAAGGTPLQVIGKALGHAEIRTTERVYAHLEIDPVRAAITKAGDAIVAAGGKTAQRLLTTDATLPSRRDSRKRPKTGKTAKRKE
jgi:integrase